MEALGGLLELSPSEAMFAAVAVFAAGVVRGFSGFALSALIMASLVLILSPVEILPLCLALEGVAGVLMLKAGLAQADRGMVLGLVAGVVVGSPIGLAVSTGVSPEAAKIVALGVIVVLALTLLGGVKMPFLATRTGLMSSGILAGVAQGLAGVGGMVVAVYALAREAPAAVVRASLVLYLIGALVIGGIWLGIYGVWTEISLIRAAVFAPFAIVGVLIGAKLFTPRFAQYYRPICLLLLIALAVLGLGRAAMA